MTQKKDRKTYTTGKVTQKGKRVSIIQASPDDPIYKCVFVNGVKILKPSSKAAKIFSSGSGN